MRKELVFKIKNNNYTNHKHYFQKDKKPININEVNIDKIVLSNKTPYGEYGANKYYIAYLNGGLRPLHIIIKDIKLYTNHMNILASDNELLKYVEIWNKIEALFNKKFNKSGFHSDPTHNYEYIRTRISSCDENFRDFKKLTKSEYCGQSILLLESICEVENEYHPRTFLHIFFEKHDNNNINNLFKELVQIVDWYDDEPSDESSDKS